MFCLCSKQTAPSSVGDKCGVSGEPIHTHVHHRFFIGWQERLHRYILLVEGADGVQQP